MKVDTPSPSDEKPGEAGTDAYLVELERRHGSGLYTSDDLGTRYPEEDPPIIFGEEIEGNPHCCVWNLTASLRAPTLRETFRRNGVTYMMAFGRTIDFELEMGNAADAARVQIIQYWKDEQYRIRVGTPNVQAVRLNPKTQPNPNPGWKWIAGADGWTVDSEDTNRCWDQRGITRRGRKVTWHDTVSTSRTTLQRYLNQNARGFGTPPNSDFPHQLTTLYKTDIFCSTKNVCDEQVAKNQETPIAMVSWRENFTIDILQQQNKWWIVGTVAQITIDNIATSVYNWCPASPHKST